MDIVSQEKRSQNMAAIRSKNTKPELFFRKLLFSRGYRYSLYSKRIPGHPDLYLRKYNTAVFINGCFWHRHEGCKYCYMPKSRIDYWQKKFASNIERDARVKRELQDKDIRCLVVWECTVKKMTKDNVFLEKCIEKTIAFLESDIEYLEI